LRAVSRDRRLRATGYARGEYEPLAERGARILRRFFQRRDFRAHEVERHLHVDLLVSGHALEIDVLHLHLVGVHVDRAQKHLFLGAVERELEDGRVELLVAKRVEQRVVVELDVDRLFLAAIDDPRDFPGIAQAAARTRALQFARLRDDF